MFCFYWTLFLLCREVVGVYWLHAFFAYIHCWSCGFNFACVIIKSVCPPIWTFFAVTVYICVFRFCYIHAWFERDFSLIAWCTVVCKRFCWWKCHHLNLNTAHRVCVYGKHILLVCRRLRSFFLIGYRNVTSDFWNDNWPDVFLAFFIEKLSNWVLSFKKIEIVKFLCIFALCEEVVIRILLAFFFSILVGVSVYTCLKWSCSLDALNLPQINRKRLLRDRKSVV